MQMCLGVWRLQKSSSKQGLWGPGSLHLGKSRAHQGPEDREAWCFCMAASPACPTQPTREKGWGDKTQRVMAPWGSGTPIMEPLSKSKTQHRRQKSHTLGSRVTCTVLGGSAGTLQRRGREQPPAPAAEALVTVVVQPDGGGTGTARATHCAVGDRNSGCMVLLLEKSRGLHGKAE